MERLWGMEILKPLLEPEELIKLKMLNTRMKLDAVEKQHYLNLKKGYEGEVMFDEFTNKLQCECYILNDLLLKVNNTTFQIDKFIMTENRLYPFEVKNNVGDYIYEEKALINKRTKSIIQNPLLQSERADTLLRQLLQSHGFHFPIESWVVFINPEFTLYHAPLDKPFVFPTQVKGFLKTLDSTPSRLNGNHKRLAEWLISLHNAHSPFNNLPVYKYDTQQKGFTCAICHSFKISVSRNKCVCGDCGHEEKVELSILRGAEELKLLFPEMKITTSLVFDWFGGMVSRRTIIRILVNNFKISGNGKSIFYE